MGAKSFRLYLSQADFHHLDGAIYPRLSPEYVKKKYIYKKTPNKMQPDLNKPFLLGAGKQEKK